MRFDGLHRSRGFSIRTQLLLLALGTGVPFYAVLAWSVAANLRLAHEKTELTVRSLAEHTANSIGIMLRNHEDVLEVLAQQPSIRTLDPMKLTATMVEVIRVHPEFNNLGLRNLRGDNIFSYQPQPSSPQMVASFPWFIDGVHNEDFTAGNAFFGRLVSRWVSVLTVPVRNDEGRIAGFLNMPLDLERLNQRLFPQSPQHAVITVVDRNGVVLLRSSDAQRFIGQPVPASLLFHSEPGSGLVSATGLDGVVRVGAVVTIPRVGWRVAVGVPEQEAYADYHEVRQRAVWFGLSALLLALALAWRIGAGIVRPSLALAQVAARVATGDGAVRAQPAGPAELKLVAQQFNRMLDAGADNAAFNRSILDSMTAVIAVLDHDGVLMAVNEAWRRFAIDNSKNPGTAAPHTGIGSNYLTTCQACVDAADADTAVTVARGIRAVLDGRQPAFSLEYCCHAPSEDRWFLVSATPLTGLQPGAVVSHTDITSRVRFEQQQLEQQSLVQARVKAENASRAKSAFLANMSHEIRTPMHAILGLVHLLRSAEATPVQAARLDRIATAGQHLMSIINDVLDLSKIDADQLLMESTDFHVATVLDHVSSIIAESAHHKGIEVRVENAGVPLWLRGDQTRLRQVLLNFAGNAVKFTERGSIMLRAQCTDHHGDDLLVRFSVEDTGIGMAADMLHRLFVPFEQLDPSTTRKFGGTGLGLAINQRLARLMGGECGVESVQGQGSKFWFTARLQLGHGVPTGRHDETRPEDLALIEAALRAEHAGAQVLLVEDNEVNREVSGEILRALGLTVDTAVNGTQAVAMAGARTYDLILMDMQMPDMDGLAATRAIRSLAAGQAVPIVALTANAFNDERHACDLAGMNDFVAKPLDLKVLYAVLRKWLPAAAGHLPPAPASAPAAEPAMQPPGLQGPNPHSLDETQRLALQALADLPGFELARGLASLRGDAGTYLRILRQFVDTRVDDMDALAASLAAGDHPTALRQAHTLYGAAATLGAQRLADLARSLETQLRAAGPGTAASGPLMASAHAIAQAYRALADTLHSALAVAQPRHPDGEPPEGLKAVRDHLAALLAQNDTDAIDYFRNHAALLKDRMGVHGNAFAQLIEGFEFETAWQALQAMDQDAAFEISLRLDNASVNP